MLTRAFSHVPGVLKISELQSAKPPVKLLLEIYPYQAPAQTKNIKSFPRMVEMIRAAKGKFVDGKPKFIYWCFEIVIKSDKLKNIRAIPGISYIEVWREDNQ